MDEPKRYCESWFDSRMAIMNPTMDSARTVLVTVFCVEAASSSWFFPMFSDVNLVRAVGKASPVMRMMIEDRKERMDRAPISVWVKAFVFVTAM